MKVLLVPSIRASMGSGHLRRCLGLAGLFGPGSAVLLEGLESALGSGSGRACSAAPAAQPGNSAQTPGSAAQSGNAAVKTLLAPLGVDPATCRILERYDPAEPWDLVILDRRSSQVEQVRRFFPVPVVGLDEGGAARRYCSYLIDTFPTCGRKHGANLSALSLMDLPVQRAESPGQVPDEHQTLHTQSRQAQRQPIRNRLGIPPEKVLISFGGEDPADLSSRLLEMLLEKNMFAPRQITLVQGPYFREHPRPEGITVIRNPADLKSMLGAYDLLFCAFGLTTYEALSAGVPVINFNPSNYHRRLSRAAGIPQIGVRRPEARKLAGLLADPEVFRELLSRYPAEIFSQSPRLSELPERLQPSAPARCPICGRRANPAAARFEGRSYFACRDCGMIYLIGFGREDVRYDEGYFFSSYRKQYGRTYLEDFQSIKNSAALRLKRIRGIEPPGLRLLDVGCAYGPFLQAASEQGFRAHGLDVAGEAVRYVREELGIPCGEGDFSAEGGLEQIQGAELGFDIITMWYVIEHFRNCGAVLRRVNALLPRGGIFAFSTPNAAGISARRNRTRFLKNSPRDHHTVWRPRSTAGILRRYGFQLRRVAVTGHHGERFPWPGALAPDSAIASGFSALSRLLRLGDTFEAYAVKQEDPA